MILPIGVFLSPMVENEMTYIYKRIINSETIEIFNQKLYEMDWSEVKVCENPFELTPFFQTKK